MFANLIESQSHGKEFKRRGQFVIATAAAYTVLFFVAGIVSIYAYDARVEAQTSELELINWVPPVAPVTPQQPRNVQPIRRQNQPNAPVDQHITIPERTDAFAPATDPTKVPDHAGTQAQPVPPVIGEFRLGTRNVNPPVVASGGQDTCVTCSGPARVVVDPTPPPTPQVVKPPIQRLPSTVLASKAISLPQPPYPTIAKQARIQGQVNIQILVDERGTVISAQVVSGNPMLTYAARDAAMRARFTPTLLNDQPAKVQGTIIYNFVLQ
jgi:periplasmic protein TonB